MGVTAATERATRHTLRRSATVRVLAVGVSLAIVRFEGENAPLGVPFQADLPSQDESWRGKVRGHLMGTSRATRGRGRVFGALLAVALVASRVRLRARRRARRPPRVAAVSTAKVPTVSPCGPGTAGPSDEIGVTPDSITVGVVADVTGARAGFRSSWDAMQAFAAYCNSLGGISGRRLDVRLFDSSVFHHRQAITDSCTSVLAIVGSAAAFDGDGASVETDCGIPDIPALVLEPAHERVPTVVAPLPNPQQLYLVGPLRHFARTAPAAVRRSAVAYLNVGVTAIRAARHVEAGRAVGYRFATIAPFPALTSAGDYARVAQRIVRHRAGYLSVQGTITDWVGVQKALAAANYRPKIVDGLPLLYDPNYPRTRGRRRRGHLRHHPDDAVRRRRAASPSSAATSTGCSAPSRAPSPPRPACAAGRPGCSSPRPPARHRATSTARRSSPVCAPSTHGTATASRSPPTRRPRRDVHLLRVRARRGRHVPTRVPRPGIRLPA